MNNLPLHSFKNKEFFCSMVNFFFLSRDDDECARFHGDRHIHKMIVEHAQILSCVWSALDHRNKPEGIYKSNKSREKHPVVLWASLSLAHYKKIISLTRALIKERKNRGFDKTHKTEAVIDILDKNHPAIDKFLHGEEWIDPPKCIPKEYHADEKGIPFDVVQSYRYCYAGDKVEIAKLKWKPRVEPPEWLDECKQYINTRTDIRDGIQKRKREKEEASQKRKNRKRKIIK